ncbi:MAG: DUF6359 domain-containing protein [Bacteroidales bacterium]|nr:DUF6359 domain-containing protein [Bacteroidales bacterium]
MKSGVFFKAAALAFLTVLLMGLASCDKSDGLSGQGRLRLRFLGGEFSAVRSDGAEIPDSNSFILDITGSDGSVVYHGFYGESPEVVSVPAGSCVVYVRSEEFSEPRFSAPQYGDDQCVIVPSGGLVDVALGCGVLNCGMVLKIASDFTAAFPTSVFYLRADEGELLYGLDEERIAYFLPGNVSVVLHDEETGGEEVLLTRSLAAKEILTLSISVADESSSGVMSMQIDTVRVWLEESYVIGDEVEKGTDISNAFSVSEARENVGKSGVWVYGYIVGGDLSSSATGINFSPPFSKDTNLAIAARASVTEKSSCLSVQLPSGSIREALNLVDHPDLVGTQVYLKGTIEGSYFNLVGVKSLKDYQFK